MGLMERAAQHAAGSRLDDIIENIRIGWNNYNFIFYITGVSAILATVFGIAGWISIVVTILFFYYVGKFRRHLERERSKKPWKY